MLKSSEEDPAIRREHFPGIHLAGPRSSGNRPQHLRTCSLREEHRQPGRNRSAVLGANSDRLERGVPQVQRRPPNQLRNRTANAARYDSNHRQRFVDRLQEHCQADFDGQRNHQVVRVFRETKRLHQRFINYVQ